MLSLVVAATLATAPFAPAAETAPPAESATLASFTPVLESIRYRPRRRGYDRPPDYERPRESYGPSTRGFTQFHLGFFDPNEDGAANSVVVGFRGGTSIEDNVQIGAGFDWSHRSDRATSVISEEPLPGGGTTVRRVELARSSMDLVPIMAFLQVSPGQGSSIRPYLGIGGGYEVLFVSAEDFNTGQNYDATFGGWGWQAWGGVAMPLSGRSKLNAELFWNQSEVERDVDDPTFGPVREIVNMDGAGMRFGLSWGF